MRLFNIILGVAIVGIGGFLGIKEIIADPVYFLELFLGGLTRGSIYALIALGYTMVYGIIQLINFAHGEIYMIGAMTALIVASVLGLWGWNSAVIVILAFVFAIVYSCAYGFTVEKIAYMPLRTAPRLSALISAIGMSLFLQNYVMLAQTPEFMPFESLIPDFEFWEPFAHIITAVEMSIIVTTVIVMILLGMLIKFTKIGKAMRATAQDKIMASLVGINVNRNRLGVIRVYSSDQPRLPSAVF